MFFVENHAENETEGLVPVLFMKKKKALHEVKTSDRRYSFNTYW